MLARKASNVRWLFCSKTHRISIVEGECGELVTFSDVYYAVLKLCASPELLEEFPIGKYLCGVFKLEF